jgi:cell division protein FtsW (lipid II flippase)
VRLRTARNRELSNLLIVGLLVVAGFTSVLVARSGAVSRASLLSAAAFVALFLVAHVALRLRLPHADPYLLPIAALLAAIGLTEIYRLDPTLARDQALWIAIGIVAFVAVVSLLGDYRRLEAYRYLLGLAALGLLALTIATSYATGTVINGARLWIRVGGYEIQPAEFAKLCLVLFLAGYLREKRELLAGTSWRMLGLRLPSARHFGPLLAMWGAAVALLVLMNDFGTSLLFFGVFLAMVYVATGRASYAAVGLAAFAAASYLSYRAVPHVAERVDVWLDPWRTARSTGYQLVQSVYAIADGGIFGSGLGHGVLLFENGSAIIPDVQTDFIYSAIASELGLAGAAGLVLLYLLFVYRGLKIATLAGDGFSKLLAAGLTIVFGLQAFLIIGGVVRLVPLTGITLPFVSYGGSSIVSNFILLALLLAVSDRVQRPYGPGAAPWRKAR